MYNGKLLLLTFFVVLVIQTCNSNPPDPHQGDSQKDLQDITLRDLSKALQTFDVDKLVDDIDEELRSIIKKVVHQVLDFVVPMLQLIVNE